MLNAQDDLHTSTQSSLLDNEPISEEEWHLSEGVTFASRWSQFEPPFDGRDVSLNTRAPNSLPESPFFAIRQVRHPMHRDARLVNVVYIAYTLMEPTAISPPRSG